MDWNELTHRRGRSVPSEIFSGNVVIRIEDEEARRCQSGHRRESSSISAGLPSARAFHSDTGLTMARTLNDPLRRKSIMHNRRKSEAFLRAVSPNLDVHPSLSQTSTLRSLMRRMSTAESMLLGEEDHVHTLASVRSMTATIAVKKHYRMYGNQRYSRGFDRSSGDSYNDERRSYDHGFDPQSRAPYDNEGRSFGHGFDDHRSVDPKNDDRRYTQGLEQRPADSYNDEGRSYSHGFDDTRPRDLYDDARRRYTQGFDQTSGELYNDQSRSAERNSAERFVERSTMHGIGDQNRQSRFMPDGNGVGNHENRGYENRGYENRGHEIRDYENRGYENRGYESRGHEIRGHENRDYESRGYESRGYENRDYESRGYENRGSENRDNGNRGHGSQAYNYNAELDSGYNYQHDDHEHLVHPDQDAHRYSDRAGLWDNRETAPIYQDPDFDRIAVEGLEARDHAYDDKKQRDGEFDTALEMEELTAKRKKPGRRKQKGYSDRVGKQNDGFEIEPDYDGGQESSDSDENQDNYMSGFDRTSQYDSSDNDKKQPAGIQRSSVHRNSGYGDIYEEIEPKSMYVHSANILDPNDVIVEKEGSDNGSDESLYRPRQFERLLRKRSTRRLRNRSTQRRSQHAKSNIYESVPYSDAVKTLANRRRAKSVYAGRASQRPRSEIAGGATDELQPDYDELEDKLPSNRLKRTVGLAERYQTLQRQHDVTSHEMASFLRDQILSREPTLLTGVSLWKYQVAMQWLRFKNWLKNWIYQLELWASSFKQIEGQFGTATMSYFRFLRWLMFLNLFLSAFLIFIVLVPFLLLQPLGDHNFADQVEQCSSEAHYFAWYFSTNYTARVAALVEEQGSGQYVLDLLQGTGWLENTELFYGIYYNKTAVYPGSSHHYTYNMSLAYLMAVGAGFLLSFLLIVKNSAKGFKERSVSTGGGSITMFCNKVFGAWDYCISQEKTAILKHQNIRQDLMNELEYQRLEWKKASRTTKERAKLYSVRFLMNFIVLAVLSVSLFLIYYTNEQLLKYEGETELNNMVLLLLQYLPSITITLLNVIVPVLFGKIVLAEDYMPAFRTKITLTRVVLLRLASLGILMYSLYYTLMRSKPKLQLDTHCDNLPRTANTTQSSSVPCWETYVGQQIYKLVILNFLVVILVTLLWEYPRKLMYDRFRTKVKAIDLLGQQEFDLSKSVLDLIYLQALCWLGMFFSPVIPAMCFVKLFIFFYMKKGSLLHNCIPVQQYGSTRSNSLFMIVLLMAFILATVPITVMIGKISPSKGCGPFRVYSSEGYVMFDAVSDLVDQWESAKNVFFFIGHGGTMAVAGFILCLLMYYFHIVGQANYKMANALREQLKLEGQDKQFLLARVNEAMEYEDEMENDEEKDDD